MKLEDGTYVAFIGWDNFQPLAVSKARALKHSKIHVGVYQNGRVDSTCTRTHGSYHNDFDSRHFEVFLGRVDVERICRFCLDGRRTFWTKLQKIEPPPKEYYFIVDLVHDEHKVVQTDDQVEVTQILKNYVAFADHLESVNLKDSKLFVIKGSLVPLDVKVRKVVEYVKFETKKE
jgi:hypothetical protein